MKKKLLGGFLWRAVFFAANFLLNIAVARRFGAQQSGVLYTTANALSLFLLVASLNIETGLGYYAAFSNKSDFTKPICWVIFFALGSGLVLIPFLLFPVSSIFFSQPGWPIWFSICFVIGNVLVSECQVLFFAKGSYMLPNIILIGFTILAAIVFSLPIHVFTPKDWQTIFFLYQFLPGVVLLLALFLKNISWQKGSSIGNFQISSVLRYSLIALGGNILFFLLYRADYWFVEHFSDQNALGNYIQVSKFGQLLLILPTIFSTIIMPRISDASIVKYQKPAALAFWVVISVCTISFLTVLLFGQALFTWLLGKDFSKMYVPALIKIPAIMFLSLQFILGTWFSGKNKVQYNLYCTMAGLIVIVVCDNLFIPKWGITGASMASLLAYLTVFTAACFLYQRKTDQSFHLLAKEMMHYLQHRREHKKRLFKLFRK